VAQLCERDQVSQPGTKKSLQLVDATRQRVEANLLARVFKGARQIVFLPLWDVGGSESPPILFSNWEPSFRVIDPIFVCST
jgi:hypothetical protein